MSSILLPLSFTHTPSNYLVMFTSTKLVALLAAALSVTALPSPKVAAVAAYTGEGVW